MSTLGKPLPMRCCDKMATTGFGGRQQLTNEFDNLLAAWRSRSEHDAEDTLSLFLNGLAGVFTYRNACISAPPLSHSIPPRPQPPRPTFRLLPQQPPRRLIQAHVELVVATHGGDRLRPQRR